MHFMFYSAEAFNADLSAWNVGSVTSMYNMFYYASAFNQVLCWDLSAVTVTAGMFTGSSGSASTSAAKCSCAAGTYHDGSTCA